jgi:small subunit ribosomal protein S1
LFVEVAKGVEGLVHISEISWTDRINDLKDKYKVGDEIDVYYIVSLDKENRRMSLSVKRLEKNPWNQWRTFKLVKDSRQDQQYYRFGIFVDCFQVLMDLHIFQIFSWTEHI